MHIYIYRYPQLRIHKRTGQYLRTCKKIKNNKKNKIINKIKKKQYTFENSLVFD